MKPPPSFPLPRPGRSARTPGGRRRNARTLWFLTLGVATLSLPACEETTIEPTVPTTLVLSTGDITLAVGDSVIVSAQVVDQFGSAIPTDSTTGVLWSSSKPGTVKVTRAALDVQLFAVSEGTAEITAKFAELAATFSVEVVEDARAVTGSLDILGGDVTTDVNTPPTRRPRLEYRAVDGFGKDVCQSVNLVFRADSAVITAVQEHNAHPADPLHHPHCSINIIPLRQGQTWLVASTAPNSPVLFPAKDSVFVRVTDVLYYAEFVDTPDSLDHVVGDTVSYTVRVYDEGDNPTVGLPVHFNVDTVFSSQVIVGNLSAHTVVTDSLGEATVAWYLPTATEFPSAELRLAFAAEVPNLRLVSGSEQPFLLPGPPADLVFFGDSELSDTVTALPIELGFPRAQRTYWVQAFDAFGNYVDTDVDVSVSDPDVAEVEVVDTYAGQAVQPQSQLVVVTGLTKPGSNVVAVAQGGVSSSADAPVIAGPEIVYRSTGVDDRVWMSQIEVAYPPRPVYDGALESHYPAFTALRDTIAFLLDATTDDWGVYTAAADGSEAAAPNALLPADLHSTYAWGFPVFRPRDGTAGDPVFISDSLGLDESNVYVLDRDAGTATKVTANDHPYVTYRGLSLSSDGTRVLVTTDPYEHAADADSSVVSNVYEVDLETGALTQLTDNASKPPSSAYRYATYAPDDSGIWIDRSGPDIDRELLLRRDGVYDKVIVEPGQSDLFQPTFNPADDATMAWLDANTIRFASAVDEDEKPGLSGVLAFSWSAR